MPKGLGNVKSLNIPAGAQVIKISKTEKKKKRKEEKGLCDAFAPRRVKRI